MATKWFYDLQEKAKAAIEAKKYTIQSCDFQHVSANYVMEKFTVIDVSEGDTEPKIYKAIQVEYLKKSAFRVWISETQHVGMIR